MRIGRLSLALAAAFAVALLPALSALACFPIPGPLRWEGYPEDGAVGVPRDVVPILVGKKEPYVTPVFGPLIPRGDAGDLGDGGVLRDTRLSFRSRRRRRYGPLQRTARGRPLELALSRGR
jgi:hypothetical protein